MCRICLNEISSQITFNLSSSVSGLTISEILMKLFSFLEPFFFEKSQELCCLECVEKIKSANDLREKCINAQKKLLEGMSSFDYVDVEVGIKSETQDCLSSYQPDQSKKSSPEESEDLNQKEESDNAIKLEENLESDNEELEIKDEEEISNPEEEEDETYGLEEEEEEDNEQNQKRTTRNRIKVLEPAEFICELPECLKKFDKNFKLVKHRIEEHQDPRPHKCGKCGKGFKGSNVKAKHMVTHSTEKNFQCLVPGCGKNFAMKNYLRLHQRVHTGRVCNDTVSFRFILTSDNIFVKTLRREAVCL